MREALRIFEDSGDKWGHAFTLNLYAGVMIELDNDYDTAWALVERGMEVARQTREQLLIGVFGDDLGYFSIRRGLYSQGQGYLEQALEVYRQFKNPGFASQTLKWLGDAARGLSNYEKAVAYYRESLAMVRNLGWLIYQATVCLSLGATLLYRCEVDKAMACFNEALDLGREHGFRFIPFYTLGFLAATCAVQHKADVAVQLFGAFDGQINALLAEGFTRSMLFDTIDIETNEHFLSLARDQLDVTIFEQQWQEGQVLPLEKAIELALATIY